MNVEEFKELQQLEESLWIAKTRFDKAYMDKILSQDFFEFGRSRRYSREECLSIPYEEINVKLPFEDFQIRFVTKEIALVTYVSEVQYEILEISNRSSLWQKTSDGWKLQFHQGTPIN